MKFCVPGFNFYNNSQLNLVELWNTFCWLICDFCHIFFCFLSLVTALLLTQLSITKTQSYDTHKVVYRSYAQHVGF
jgi:hypothetical protein